MADEDSYDDRVAKYQEELDDAVYALAEKYGLEIAYYKSEDREGPGRIDGQLASDLTHAFQVCDAS